MQRDLTGLVLDDRYLLQERLGAGGMGEVWRCRDQRIGRDVAVKLLLDLRLNAEMEARFEREARVAGNLSSPLIVTLHDYGHGDLAGRDTPYLVMELLQGRTLAQIRNDERNSRRVLTWGAQVCAALEVAHRAGVVHRDIKPGNVMITDDGGLKVLDFGIARVVADGQTRGGLTADGTVIGTADYMSPEQAAGQPIDSRSDLYSFGCLLYFLVAARPPFVADTFFGTLQLQLNGTPEPPSKYRPGLPPELDGLILALLAKDPAARLVVVLWLLVLVLVLVLVLRLLVLLWPLPPRRARRRMRYRRLRRRRFRCPTSRRWRSWLPARSRLRARVLTRRRRPSRRTCPCRTPRIRRPRWASGPRPGSCRPSSGVAGAARLLLRSLRRVPAYPGASFCWAPAGSRVWRWLAGARIPHSAARTTRRPVPPPTRPRAAVVPPKARLRLRRVSRLLARRVPRRLRVLIQPPRRRQNRPLIPLPQPRVRSRRWLPASPRSAPSPSPVSPR